MGTALIRTHISELREKLRTADDRADQRLQSRLAAAGTRTWMSVMTSSAYAIPRAGTVSLEPTEKRSGSVRTEPVAAIRIRGALRRVGDAPEGLDEPRVLLKRARVVRVGLVDGGRGRARPCRRRAGRVVLGHRDADGDTDSCKDHNTQDGADDLPKRKYVSTEYCTLRSTSPRPEQRTQDSRGE